MLVTIKKLEANRANALKSTGPKTPEGLRRSSRNAIRHGLLANSVLIEGESRDEFLTLLRSFEDEYHPETPTEIGLVHKAAVSQWRLLRTWTFDATAITHEMHRQAQANPEALADKKGHTRAMLAARALNDSTSHLDRMSIYEHRFDIQHRNAIRDLDRLCEKRRARDRRSHSSEENTELIAPEASRKAMENPNESHRIPQETHETTRKTQQNPSPDRP